MTTDSLLPPNATKLERALEEAMRPGEDVVTGIDLIRTAKEDPPDDWLYWLIWEYGLEEVLPYIEDPRVALESGIQWMRIRGTPNSLRMAFSWIEQNPGIEQEEADGMHWFEYQLETESVPTYDVLVQLVGLARLSAPEGTILSRIYFGYDRRRAKWDECDWSGGELWSDHSGVFDPDLGVTLSFGRVTTWQVVLKDGGDIAVAGIHEREHAGKTTYIDSAVWDSGGYGDERAPANFPMTITREFTEDIYHCGWADVGWNNRAWECTLDP